MHGTMSLKFSTILLLLLYIIFPCVLLCATSDLIGTNSTNITRHRREQPFPGNEASNYARSRSQQREVKQSIYRPGLALRALEG